MKMKSWGIALALSGTLFIPLTAAAEDLLTGDTRLACEAILCLSSGNRPSECNPALRRYFSINEEKLKDTLNARRNFLNLCPSSKEPHMPQLIRAISRGAGRCDAAELNRRGHYEYNADGSRQWVVNPNKPAYCNAYENHEWTRVYSTKLEPVYCTRVTREMWSIRTEKYQCGQKWVDVK